MPCSDGGISIDLPPPLPLFAFQSQTTSDATGLEFTYELLIRVFTDQSVTGKITSDKDNVSVMPSHFFRTQSERDSKYGHYSKPAI